MNEKIIIQKCTLEDVPQLALLNKRLIEDEKSNNSMSIKELEVRMQGFLNTEYSTYFFDSKECSGLCFGKEFM